MDSNLVPKFWTDVQISLPSVLRQTGAGEERLTKYFSDANVVNFVRGEGDTGTGSQWGMGTQRNHHPSGTLASCQTPASDRLRLLPQRHLQCCQH